MAKKVVEAVMDLILRNVSGWRREYNDNYIPVDENNNGRTTMEADDMETLQDRKNNLTTIPDAKDILELTPTGSDSGFSDNHSLDNDKNQYENDSGYWPNTSNLETDFPELNSTNSSYIQPTSSDVLLKPKSYNLSKDQSAPIANSPSLLRSTIQGTPTKPLRPELKFCDQKATCLKGNSCKDKHTPKEKIVFADRTKAKTANSRDFNEAKFRTQMCNANDGHNLLKCRFAHRTDQLICVRCLEVGHNDIKCGA